MANWRDKGLLLLRFASGGVPGVLLYYLIFWGITNLTGLYLLSAVIASGFCYGCNFYIQKNWTFRNKDKSRVARQMAQYVTMIATLFVLNLVILYVLVEYAHLWYMTAQVISTLLVTTISFFWQKRIFKNPPPPQDPEPKRIVLIEFPKNGRTGPASGPPGRWNWWGED